MDKPKRCIVRIANRNKFCAFDAQIIFLVEPNIKLVWFGGRCRLQMSASVGVLTRDIVPIRNKKELVLLSPNKTGCETQICFVEKHFDWNRGKGIRVNHTHRQRSFPQSSSASRFTARVLWVLALDPVP
jgi:hypothetical protein